MSKSLRVLVIEDSEDDAALLIHELRRGGYEPVFKRVDTEATFRAALTGQDWDIVIADYSLPHFSAPAALKLLQESGLDLPCIIVSGVIGEDVAVEAMKAGAHDCIMKYNLKRLLPAVERELRDAEERRDHRKAEEEARHAQQYYRLLIDNASDIIAMLGEDLTIKFASPSAQRLLDYKRGEFIGQSAVPLIHPEDVPAALEILNRAIKSPGTTHSIEMRLRSKDGRWLNLEMLGKYISIDPSRTGLILSARDVTERRRVQGQLRQSEERFRELAENINEVFFLIGPSGTPMIYISPAYADVWGRSCESLYANPLSWIESIHPEDRPRVEAQMRTDVGKFQMEYRIIRPDGSVRWLWARTFPIRDENGNVYRLAGIAEDITLRHNAEDRVQHLAYFDALTGLPNRNTQYNRLLGHIRTDTGRDKRLGLLLLDLNHFKEINDTLGRAAGDEILKQVGQRLQSAVMDRDIVARPGGDEFSILIFDLAGAKDINAVIEKVVKALDSPFIIENLPIRIEASIGVALYPDHGDAPDTLYQRADVAMHFSKSSGVSHIVYDPAQDKHSTQRLSLMGELHYSIEHEGLQLYYQPKISMKTGWITGVEALLRWVHPNRGMIPPDQFILPAEQTGLIHPLTRWVKLAAIRQYKAWHDAGTELNIAINISARNLLDPKLPSSVAEQLRAAGVSPNCMTFEITESAIMADPVKALEILVRLHEMGIRLSIDDFGIGYSSLVYLKKLPVDTIKIDKSFVINMIHDKNDAVIVRSTIDLAHNLGLEVIAEGVESEEIWNRLTEMGCDTAQGYYMCRPIPADQLSQWLKESPWAEGKEIGRSRTSLPSPS
jgi:diguanylate cyclase (GGDEF)-like protein/PAS domain S-box-containing protein